MVESGVRVSLGKWRALLKIGSATNRNQHEEAGPVQDDALAMVLIKGVRFVDGIGQEANQSKAAA